MGGGDYNPNGKSLRKIATQLNNYYPKIVTALGNQILPASQYEQNAQNVIAPQQEALNAKLYAENAPIYSNAAANADLSAIQGAGGQAVREADKLSRQIDPEYYSTRDATSEKLKALLSGMDPNKLTGAESETVSRGLARYGANTGTLNTPTSGSAIKAALEYGSALQQKRNTVSNAVGTATAALPTFRSGIDAFGQATGRAGTSAFGGGFNTNAASVGNAQAQGTGTLGITSQLEQLRQQLQSQRRHYTDFVNQSYTAAGSGTSGFAGVMGCWILREAFDYNLSPRIEALIPRILANKELRKKYVNLASKVVPLMRINPEFKAWVKNNFALPLIQAYE